MTMKSATNLSAIENLRSVLSCAKPYLEKAPLETTAIIPVKSIEMQNILLRFLKVISEQVNEAEPKAALIVGIPKETPQTKRTKSGNVSKSTVGMEGRITINYANNAHYIPTQEDQSLPDDIWKQDVFSLSHLIPLIDGIMKSDEKLQEAMHTAELTKEECSALTNAICGISFAEQFKTKSSANQRVGNGIM
jgi:hypothetical protein